MTDSAENKPARRNIWGEFDPFRNLFDAPLGSRLLQRPWGDVADRGWAPAVDVAENENGYVVTAELAGADKDDITVECHENVLTIKGEKRDEREEKDEHRHYVERSYGSFSRGFRMPPDASNDIKASFKDGILTVEVAKHEEKKPRVVSID